jgi:hypothetical protein
MESRAVWCVSVAGVALLTIGRLAEFTVAEAGRYAVEAPAIVTAANGGNELFHGVVAGVLGNAVYNSLVGTSRASENRPSSLNQNFLSPGASLFRTKNDITFDPASYQTPPLAPRFSDSAFGASMSGAHSPFVRSLSQP